MNTAIKSLAFLTIASFIFMGGCVTKLTTVNFDYGTKTSASTGNLAAGTHVFMEKKMTSDLDSFVKTKGVSLDMLDELRLKSAQVTITLPAGSNFDNCDNIELWIATDIKPEVMLASKNPVGKGLSTVVLDVNSSENLQEYLKSAEFIYRIKGTNNAPLTPMTMELKAEWAGKASKK